LHGAITGNNAPTADLAARVAVVVTAHSALRDASSDSASATNWSQAGHGTRIAAHHRGRIRAEQLTMAAVTCYCA